jgi:mono/diheme cytochrome c family protein
LDEKRYIRTYQLAVAGASALLILLILSAWVITGPQQEWRRIQRDHLDRLAHIADTSEFITFAMPEKGIHQYEIAALNRTDRCVTCHLGMENPFMQDAAQPHGTHPPGFFDHHPPDKYGCTICHGGQGRALNSRDAHGIDRETHWDRPLFSQPFIQSTCGQCHLAVFRENERFAGTEVFSEGQEIFNREGCLGCHKARGVGGIIGPDLTEQGEKTRHEYNFQNIETEQTVSNWLKEHFRDPEMVSPGSQMLKIDIPEEELDALTTFVLGLARPDIDFEYFSLNTLNEFKGNRDTLEPGNAFSMACAACHGKEGKGKSYEEFETGVPGIMLDGFRSVVSEEYVHFTLQKGRSQRQMASWMTEISGLRDGEIMALSGLVHGSARTEIVPYDPALFRQASPAHGQELFQQHCAACHGTAGKGDVALMLNQEDLMRNAGNDYLFGTLVTGRGNATMPSWKHLEVSALYDLVSYMRSWHAYNPVVPSVRFEVTDPDAGKLNFLFMCSRCHGEFGQGQTGPAIINKDFLRIAPDEFLYNAIAFGRDHSAMFGWSTDVYNAERLAEMDIGNIIAYMRRTAEEQPAYLYPGTNRGDIVPGEKLYKQHCAECHGMHGEGEKAPALNNQELLSAATNGYLLATLTVGREGTAMPAWAAAGEDHPVLTGRERQDIVAWIRHWQRIRIAF